MSLSRQLIILIALLVLLLFAGTFAISINNMRAYLESQLASHAQDAATSLGLSATTHVEAEDQALVTAMVNAIFHRGDYLSIRFEDLHGRTGIERVAELEVDDVPDWFTRLFPLQAPMRKATVMSGWRQLGRVEVTSHPGLAYRQLWQTSMQTLNLFLVGALLAVLAGTIVLRLLLRPLKAIERQATAICNREFPLVDRRPFTTEFRRVVDAMNRLSGKVGRMLEDSGRQADELREQAFEDPVTGLANRRQFMDVLEHRLAAPDLLATGGLLLLQLKGFKAFNQAQGYAAGDRLLAEAGRALAALLVGEPRSTLARLSGADFGMLLDGLSEEALRRLAADATGALTDLYRRLELPSADVAHIGGIVYEGQDVSELLAAADMALRQAQAEGVNAWIVHRRRPQGAAPRSASAWRELIGRAIREQRFRLLRQPVMACRGGELLHHELFLRVQDPERQDAAITAAELIPMAENVGLAPAVDRAVIEAVVLALQAGAYPGRVAVNLSAASLADPGQVEWVLDKLQQHPVAAGQLILELPEYAAQAYIEPLIGWIDILTPLGVEFSLDHFGRGFTSFAHLRALKVNYLKVDGSFVSKLGQQDANRFFLRAIADIAHGLDMLVVAESVESDADWQALATIGIDAGRGYWLGRPE